MRGDSRKRIEKGNGARTEQALRDSELSYRRLFEAAQDGILILDADTGRITDVNPFLTKLLGYSHGEMVGYTVGELSPFKDVVANYAMLERLQKNGYVRYEDLPLETKDGRNIAVEFVSNAYQAGGKKVIQCNIRDNTEHKRTAEKLLEGEEKYRGIFEGSLDAITTIEPPSWRFTSGNPAAVKMFNAKSEEDLLSYAPWELSPERQPDGLDSAGQARKIIEKVLNEGSHFFEWTHRRIDGGEFLASVLLSRRHSNGKVIIQAAVRDITELKKTQQEAAREHARLKFIFESIPIGICLNMERPDGSVMRLINDAHLRICGITREQEREGGGELWKRISVPEDYERQLLLYRQVAEGKTDRFSFDKRYV